MQTITLVKKLDTIGKVWTIEGLDSEHCRIVLSGGEYGVFIHNSLKLRTESMEEVHSFLKDFFSYRFVN